VADNNLGKLNLDLVKFYTYATVLSHLALLVMGVLYELHHKAWPVLHSHLQPASEACCEPATA
jgi:hypothetical protein